jgi:hypothetical protein
MLISDSKGFLFVHVQKTAGSSIRKVLDPFAVHPSRSLLNKLMSRLHLQRDFRRFYFRPHARLRLAEQVIPPARFARLFKFAFVRNPWDRLVSWYSFILQNPDHRRHRLVVELGSFEAYVHFEIERDKISQYDMLAGRDGEIRLDFVGRFENLREDVGHVFERLGVEAELPREKVSRHAAYPTFYTPETVELVRRHWSKDIETFGYQFEGEPGAAGS